jgi:hypothetical protein
MIALALTPVVVALAGRVESVAGRIWPGLAAVAGLMLVVAQPSLGDARSDVALCLMPVLTGCGAALLSSEGGGIFVESSGCAGRSGAGLWVGLGDRVARGRCGVAFVAGDGVRWRIGAAESAGAGATGSGAVVCAVRAATAAGAGAGDMDSASAADAALGGWASATGGGESIFAAASGGGRRGGTGGGAALSSALSSHLKYPRG